MKNNLKSEMRYFQFPLCMLQKILLNPDEGYGAIISYSIVNYAKNKVKYTLNDVYRQVMYDYCRAEHKLSPSLWRKIKQYINSGELTYNEEYEGFNQQGAFTPATEETRQLMEIWEKDKGFKEQAILHYQVNVAADFLKVTLGSMETTLANYDAAKTFIEEHEKKYGNEPEPGIKTSFLFEFRDKKNETDNELLCAYIAIRSILGKNKFCSTHKSVILMRMLGAKSNEALKEHIRNLKLKKVYEQYSHRKRMDTLLKRLVNRGFLRSKAAYGRTLYLSHELGFEELPNVIIEKKERYSHLKKEKEANSILKEYFSNRGTFVQKGGAKVQQEYINGTAEGASRGTAMVQLH